jgi:hypothetical protein
MRDVAVRGIEMNKAAIVDRDVLDRIEIEFHQLAKDTRAAGIQTDMERQLAFYHSRTKTVVDLIAAAVDKAATSGRDAVLGAGRLDLTYEQRFVLNPFYKDVFPQKLRVAAYRRLNPSASFKDAVEATK